MLYAAGPARQGLRYQLAQSLLWPSWAGRQPISTTLLGASARASRRWRAYLYLSLRHPNLPDGAVLSIAGRGLTFHYLK
jgi:hypothetical protein